MDDKQSYLENLIKNGDIESNLKEIKKAYTDKELISYQPKRKRYKNLFLFAVRFGDLPTIKIVANFFKKKKHKEIFSTKDKDGRNALMLALVHFNENKNELNIIAIIKYLLKELNLYINYRNKEGLSALTYSIDHECQQAFDYLLLHGAKFEEKEEDLIKEGKFKEYFYSPDFFLVAVKSQNFNAFQLILNHIKGQKNKKPFIEATNTQGQNALIITAKEGDSDFFKPLLRLGFDLEKTDNKNKTLVNHLTKTNTIVFSDLITQEASNTKQEGKKTKKKELKRHPQSFSDKRERQLLRHASTQIYFALKKQLHFKSDEKLVEIQMMHLVFHHNSNLFIAINYHNVGMRILDVIKNQKTLEKSLLENYTSNINDAEGKCRTKRFSEKLNNRVFGENIHLPKSSSDHDSAYAYEVAKTLRKGEICPLAIDLEKDEQGKLSARTQTILKHLFFQKTETIFILLVEANPKSTYKKRHGEEFLCDIAEYAQSIAKKKQYNYYSSIGGKKRPCMGCYGRMEGSISNYNQYPGRFWKHTIENQSEKTARNTLNTLIQKPSYITYSDNTKLTDYDTESDSSGNDDATLSSITSSVTISDIESSSLQI